MIVQLLEISLFEGVLAYLFRLALFFEIQLLLLGELFQLLVYLDFDLGCVMVFIEGWLQTEFSDCLKLVKVTFRLVFQIVLDHILIESDKCLFLLLGFRNLLFLTSLLNLEV